MPVTRQTTSQGGSDRDESTRNGTSTTTQTGTSQKSGTNTSVRNGTTTTTQTGTKTAKPSTTVQRSTGGQAQTEDYAFSISFEIECNQAVPCEEV